MSLLFPLRFHGLGTVNHRDRRISVVVVGRIKVYQAADLSTLLLRPACFHPTSCTSAMIGAYALRSSLPLAVWLRYRFIQAAIALSLIPSSVALLLMFVVGFRCVFCFDFCFLFSRSLALNCRCFSMSSLRPSSLTGPSPCLYTAGAYCFRGRCRIRTCDALTFTWLHPLAQPTVQIVAVPQQPLHLHYL